MKIWARTKTINKGVIHVNVGPETPITSGESLVKYLASITGGYHHVHDDDGSIRCANDNQCVAGAKGGDANEAGLHYCIIGRADQSRDQWLDNFSRAAMSQCAQRVSKDCATYGLAPRRLSSAEMRGGTKGLCGHGDVTSAFGVAGGHTDPGPNFPWDYFTDLVKQGISIPNNGGTDVKPTDETSGFVGPDGLPVILHADGGVFKYSKTMPTWPGAFNVQGLGIKLTMGLNHAVSLLPTPGYGGYWMLLADGGIFTFGNAPYKGNAGALASFACRAIELSPNGSGYDIIWECYAAPNGGVSPHP